MLNLLCLISLVFATSYANEKPSTASFLDCDLSSGFSFYKQYTGSSCVKLSGDKGLPYDGYYLKPDANNFMIWSSVQVPVGVAFCAKITHNLSTDEGEATIRERKNAGGGGKHTLVNILPGNSEW